jgi:PAS domain S-box-containing protein
LASTRNAARGDDRLMAERLLAEITERKRIEAELNERNRELKLVVDSVPVMITRLDREERFLFANRAYTEFMERPLEDIIGRKVGDVITPAAYAQIKSALDRTLSGETVSAGRVQYRSNGDRIEIEGRYIPDVDAEGRVIGLIAVHRDVTAERRARESLAKSEARFRSLTDLSSDWYWEQDALFRYVYITADADARGAVGMKERAGKTRWELPWCGVTDEQWAAHRAQLEAHEVFHDFEIGRPTADGRTVWVSVSGEPIFDARGRFAGYRGVTRNITERKLTEQSLRAQTERLQIGQAAARLIVMDWDIPNDLLVWSDSPEWLRGPLPASGRYPLFKDQVHVDDRARFLAARDASVNSKRDGSVEFRIVRTDGEVLWLLSREKVFADGSGKAVRMLAALLDITHRKSTEQARAASDALKSAMLASALDAIVSMDSDGRILEFNPAAEQCFGWSRDEARGRTVAELLVPEELRERHSRGIAQLARGSSAPLGGRRIEMPALRRDGRRITVEIAIARLPDVVPPVFAAFLRDVTDRKRAQDALAESEARFRAIFERSNAGMAITDASGLYMAVNAAFARFFGYPAEELVGKLRVRDLRAPDDAEGDAYYGRLIKGEIGFYERDRPYRRKDGTIVWGRATVSAVHDTARDSLYAIAVITDITDEMTARSRLESMNVELEERVEKRTTEMRAALKELDAFTYSVSHDLRAPIGAVSGFAHLLRTAEAPRLSEDGLRLLGFIEHNAERMTRLIEGLLRFSRLGRSDLHRTRVSMNALLAESLLDFVDETARARVTAGSMPECHGDPALLSQVWSNLMGNAFKYSRGAAAPSIDVGWDAARKAYYVRDNGVGFDMAYAGKLFGVFERLHAESEFEGSGIGLAIAERIIRLHGGAIWADAAPGRGATFWFTVPASASGAAPSSSSWEN